ncbi:MAG: translation initiation factor IF-3 [Pyrinomonadaceae bacterium]
MRINDRIRVPQVRVVGEDGEQFGVMGTREAVALAREKGMDLVEVAATADPPVCRIIDYGKFQYENKKKAHEAKKKQVIITVKEVKFRPGTDDHDYDYRVKHARDWLIEGDKVKATIWFRGREMAHRELGVRILERLEKDLTDIAEVEVRPKMEGNQMFIIMTPKRGKAEKVEKAERPPRPKPDAEAKPEVKPEAKVEVKPEPKPEPVPVAPEAPEAGA